MELDKFIENFYSEFDETPRDAFSPATVYKELEEWNSLTALSIISMIDDQYGKTITGADLRKHATIEELFSYIESL